MANVGIGMRADKMTEKGINLKKLFEEVVSKNPAICRRFESAALQGNVSLFGLPLGSKRRKLHGDNFLLLGDAAMLIDPFTGEGIGNGMMSGMMAADVIQKALQANDCSYNTLAEYDKLLYKRLGEELQLSYRMQQLVNFPSLFNFVVKKANSNPLLRETISCMFDDIELRNRLRKPSFYLRLLFS
jgi:flavin-dependent dehydrogenase